MNLEEKQEADHLATKRKRLRGKQAVSTMRVEGETAGVAGDFLEIDEDAVTCAFLEQLHGNITSWVAEGMEILDSVNDGQEWWFERACEKRMSWRSSCGR